MKYSAAAAVVLGAAAAAAIAVPTKRSISDTDILQYALTLEHLENYFYSHFLEQFDQAAFMAAGFPDWVRNRVENIASHEAQHVTLLAGVLGAAATQPCTYAFPGVTDPVSFMATATLVENVGVSAYLGAASSITEAAYVTVAGSILTTEARHQSWLYSSVEHGPGWSGPEDTPLDFSEVYSIASAFITGCPSTNPTLPVQAFPALSIAADGTITTNATTPSASMDGTYIQLIAGLETNTFPVSGAKVADLPTPQGIAYAVLTTEGNTTLVSDSNILAGPFIMNNPFLSKYDNPAPSF